MMFFIDCVVKITLLLSASLVATHFLRHQSAALRHSVLVAGLICAFSVPVFLSFVPALRWVPVFQFRQPAAQVKAPALPRPAESEAMPVALDQKTTSSAATRPSRQSAGQQVSPAPYVEAVAPAAEPQLQSGEHAWIFATIYFAGVAAGVGTFALSVFRLARITRNSRSVLPGKWQELASTSWPNYKFRRLRLLESAAPNVLATWGLFRPKVIIPAGAIDWTESRIVAVLTHELAHVQRCDWVILIAAEIFRTLLWFNPVAWIVARRLRHESELACDDVVLNRGTGATEYAGHLLDVARVLGKQDLNWAPGLLMAGASMLERRFSAMLDSQVRRTEFSRRGFVFILAAFLFATVPLAALRQIPQEAPAAVTVHASRLVGTVSSAVTSTLLPQSIPALAKPNSIVGI